jgi:hypothetical protein
LRNVDLAKIILGSQTADCGTKFVGPGLVATAVCGPDASTTTTTVLNSESVTKMTHLAYLDPGTGSFFLQLVVGGMFGGLLMAKHFWQKVKGAVSREVSQRTGQDDAVERSA